MLRISASPIIFLIRLIIYIIRWANIIWISIWNRYILASSPLLLMTTSVNVTSTCTKPDCATSTAAANDDQRERHFQFHSHLGLHWKASPLCLNVRRIVLVLRYQSGLLACNPFKKVTANKVMKGNIQKTEASSWENQLSNGKGKVIKASAEKSCLFVLL